MAPCILSDMRNAFSRSSAALMAFLNAGSAIFSLFFRSISFMNEGQDRARRMTSEYSLDGTCPSRYRVTVISPKPRARESGVFPILKIVMRSLISSIETMDSALRY